ncbi:MAG: leucine-rich repeat protein [Bacteroidaceae bacterium]|nr:leucine-rich repeat protein [Bacteroidaceae bacterium]
MKKILWTLAVIAMAALSCTKQENGVETNPVTDGPDDVTYLKINSVTTSELAKSAIKGTSFPFDEEVSIGLFVVGDGYDDYCNVKCTKPADSDEFNAPLIELKEDKATVYAYYPYDANIETFDDLKSIPVESSVGGDDWMWATPVTEVSTEKPAIDLTFNHALALVEITFNVYGPEAAMTNVTLAGSDDGAFSKAGIMDATDGAITPDATQNATKTSPFSQEVSLQLSDGKIVADCLLVPCKTGTDADARQDFYIKCTYNGKTYSASLTGSEKGVIIRKNTKSTIVLNIKDNTLEVVSVGVASWTNPYVSGNTATIDGHKVTFNFDKASGLNPSITVGKSSSAITMDDPEDMPENALVSKAIFKYDPTVITDEKFISCESGAGCNCVLDKNDHTITVTDVTQDVTVNVTVGNSTRIFYTAKSKVEPYDKTAMGVPFDAERSTFDAATGNGVMYFDGIVTTVGADAFKEYSLSEQNNRLTSIEIPESVTSIGVRAFQNCTFLETVSLPKGLTTIGDEAFEYCYELKPQFPSSLETIGGKAFLEAGKYALAAMTLTLPGSLKSIGESAFEKSKVANVDLSSTSLSKLPDKVFLSCSELEQVSLPSSLAEICSCAFAECNKLKTINLASDAAPTCSSDAFQETSKIIEDVIVKQSTGHATLLSFKKANGWKDIPNGVIREQGTKVSIIRYTANSRVEPRTGASFGEGSEYLNDECCSPYDSGTKAGEMFVINFSQIGAEAFSEYAISDEAQKKLTNITIPEGVTSIGAEAFRGCIKLESVALPENLTTLTAIGDRAFEYCYVLAIPSLPASVETLGAWVFDECKTETSVDLSKCTKLKSIKEYSFRRCYSLTEVKLPEGIESLGEGVFNECSSLKAVDLSKCTGLKTIPEYCFNACTHLAEVKLPAGLETIEKNAFWHMGKDIEAEAGWKPLNLPSSLKEIGNFAFEDSRFTSLTLPAALKTVGTDVFKYSSVKTLTIEAGAVIGKKMFNDCSKLETITCKSTTPPNIIYDSLCSFAKEDGNYSLTNIKNIYVPSSIVGTYQSAPGWTWYSGKISAIQ